MIPFLAQATTEADYAGIGHFVRNLVEIGGIVFFIWKAAKGENMKVGPQPFLVDIKKEFASKTELQELKDLHDRRHAEHAREIRSIYGKLETDKNQIIQAGEDRAIKIHDRINDAIESIGELRGEMRRIN